MKKLRTLNFVKINSPISPASRVGAMCLFIVFTFYLSSDVWMMHDPRWAAEYTSREYSFGGFRNINDELDKWIGIRRDHDRQTAPQGTLYLYWRTKPKYMTEPSFTNYYANELVYSLPNPRRCMLSMQHVFSAYSIGRWRERSVNDKKSGFVYKQLRGELGTGLEIGYAVHRAESRPSGC